MYLTTEDSLTRFKILQLSEAATTLSWARGLWLTWPSQAWDILAQSQGDELLVAEAPGGTVTLRRPVGDLLFEGMPQRLRMNRLFSGKPMSARLPFGYQKVPYQLRWLAAGLLVRIQRHRLRAVPTFPCWPLDLSVDALADLIALLTPGNGDKGDIGPGCGRVALTHDIDNVESLNNLNNFLKIEHSFDAKSTSFIVPSGWPLDHRLLENIIADGHEIGAHGHDHNNRTPFLDRRALDFRMAMASEFRKLYQVKGYRSPSLLRTEVLMDSINKYYLYDSSVPNVEGYYSSKPRGCATARPFQYDNGLIELPLTMPSDANLLFQGYDHLQILDIWKRLAAMIHRSKGNIILLTHCERRYSGNVKMLKIYENILSFLNQLDVSKWQTMAQIALKHQVAS